MSQEEGENTIVYEKEVVQLPLKEARLELDQTKFLQEVERDIEKPKQTSRERRKRFAEQRSRAGTSQTVDWPEGGRQGRRHTHHTHHTCSQTENIAVPRKQFSAQY